MTEPIAEDVRRFILTSIPSVPHLEAMLLLRAERDEWDAPRLAQRLYVGPDVAAQLLTELCAAGMLAAGAEAGRYRYQPVSDELARMLDQVAAAYARNIVAVAHMIHSKTGKRAQQFADAFKFRKDPP